MNRLVGMQVFAKSVELGSFSAAAAALDMSPQLAGKHVAMLEKHLGVRLLQRTTRHQSLTDFGRDYLERVKLILAEVDAADNLAAQTHAEPRGRLRVNAPVSFGNHLLAPRLADYMNRCPEVAVELILSNRTIDLVEEGYDAVFHVGELADSHLIARQLAPYQLVACAAPAYLERHPPIRSPADLQHHECLRFAYSAFQSGWTFNTPEGRTSIAISGRLVANHVAALVHAATAGLGVALLPRDCVADTLHTGALVEVLPAYPIPAPKVHILYARDRRMTPKLRSFIDFAVQAFA